MYKTIIKLSKELSEEKAAEFVQMANKAFDNRAGRVENTSEEKNVLIYDGREEDYGCIHLGILDLHDIEEFRTHVEKWDYVDEDNPRECCDVLYELSIPVR